MARKGSKPTLPTGWREVTLGDLCEFRAGSVFKLHYQGRGSGHYPFIKVRDMNLSANEVRINEATNWINQDVAKEIKAKPIPEGSIVFAKIGEALKQNRLRMTVRPTIVDNNMMGAIPKTDIVEPGFLFYGMHQFDFGEIASGTALPYLTMSELANLPMSIPPLPEQRAIAHILGTLDDKIELNRRMNQTLEEMARAIFKSWFVDFDPVRAKMEGRDVGLPPDLAALFPDRLVDSELGAIPAGWEVKPLGELCDKPQYGYTQSGKDEPIGPKFLRITDINKKAWIEWDSVPHCEITEDAFDKYRLKEGDVLIARMADPGHGCMIEEEQYAVFASYLIRFRPMHGRYARFIQYWLRSDNYWELVKGRGAGTTRISLNAKVISEFPILVPNDSLLDTFGEQINVLRTSVVANYNESCALTAQRDALLPGLVSGELKLPVQRED